MPEETIVYLKNVNTRKNSHRVNGASVNMFPLFWVKFW